MRGDSAALGIPLYLQIRGGYFLGEQNSLCRLLSESDVCDERFMHLHVALN